MDDLITEALLAPNQQRSIKPLTVPLRLRIAALPEVRVGLNAGFIQWPAFRQPPEREIHQAFVIFGFGVIGLERERAIIRLNSLIMQCESAVDVGEIVMRCGIIGLKRKRLIVMPDRLVVQRELVIDIRKIVMRRRIIWFQRDCSLAPRCRLVQPPHLFQCAAEIYMRLGQSGLEGNRPLVLDDRFFAPAERIQDRPHSFMSVRTIYVPPSWCARSGHITLMPPLCNARILTLRKSMEPTRCSGSKETQQI